MLIYVINWIDYYGNFKITHSDVDTNMDGKMDQRIRYDALGLVRNVAGVEQPGSP